MNTITVWLLISIGTSYSGSGNMVTHVVERFPTLSECERVRKWLAPEPLSKYPNVGCIQATIVRPEKS